MKRNIITLSLLTVLLGTFEYAYPQTISSINTEKVVVKRYGLTYPARILDFVYEFVYPLGDSPAITKIREQILVDYFSAEPTYATPPQELLIGGFSEQLAAIQEWYEDDVIKGFAGEIAPMEEWGQVKSYDFRTSTIRNNHNKVLVYCIASSYSNGIAHPRYYNTCINYDLQSGNQITLADLFDEANIKRLDAIVNEELKSQENYTVGTIENFIMLPKGIQFVYNEYIAGPYSAGTVRATIPLSKFRHLLKDSALTYFEE
jgi:hypothetical protein